MKKSYINLLLFAIIFIIFIFAISYQGVEGFITPKPGSPYTLWFQNDPIQIRSENVRLVTPISSIIKADVEIMDDKNRGVKSKISPTLSIIQSSLGDVNMEFKSSSNIKKSYLFEEDGRTFGSIGEKLSCKILEEFLERKTILHLRPEWLTNPHTNRRLELDVYDPKTEIAIEYNGIQHYKYEQSMHKSHDDLNYQIYKDKLKAQKCKDRGVELIIVPYTVDNMKYVNGKMKNCRLTLSEKEIKLRNYILPQLETIFFKKYGILKN